MISSKRVHRYTARRVSRAVSFLRSSAAASLIYTSLILISAVGTPAQKGRLNSPTLPTNNNQQQSPGEARISENVARQIKALDDEKESRTPAQQKIDSQLLYAGKMFRGQSIAEGIPTLEVDVGMKDDGMVIVDITAIVNADILTLINKSGGEVISSSAAYQTLRARVSINVLEDIAALPTVKFIQPKQEYQLAQQQMPQRPNLLSGDKGLLGVNSSLEALLGEGFVTNAKDLPNGTISTGGRASEGDWTHKVSTARGIYNADGTGIKVGVLSNGVTNLAASQATGDLGAVTVLAGQAGTGDEGTAMLEIVHDLVPGAQLYFATGNTGITQFAQNIRDLRTAGCDVIVDDIGYFVEAPFQDGQTGVTTTNGGVVTQAVNDVVAGGTIYFSSAANSGNKNDGTSGTWEGDFVSAGTIAIVSGGGNVADFDTSAAVSQFDSITVAGTGPISLAWSDPLGASSNDYDLFLLNNTSTSVLASATNTQSGTQDPYEQIAAASNVAGRRIVIRQKTGAADRFLHLNTNRGRVAFSTEGETHGHNAASGAYGVAASPVFVSFNFAPASNPGPYPNAYSAANKVENFSSDGPRRIFFTGNGTAITPGVFSSAGGTVLQQPIITAADGVEVTGVGGFGSPFYGTSAAAPHAAAIAALIKSVNPAFTPAQIKTALTTTAVDIEGAGTDRDAGTGVIMPLPALQSLAATGKAFLELGTVTATESCCNGNGIIERNESGKLDVSLANPGLLNATGVTATLATTTPNVTVWQNASAYSNMNAGGSTATNATQFGFSVLSGAPVDVTIDFQLTVNYTGGWNASQVINFQVETGRKPISTVLDTTAPTTNLSFPTAITGTQTNLLFPNDPLSTCASVQANPGLATATTPRFDAYTLTNITASPICATVTLTVDKTSPGAMQAVAYTPSFSAANPSTNYLGDAGFAALIAPGYPETFSVSVPASATVVITVADVNIPASGFPSTVNTPYTLKVAGLPLAPLSPTAATVTIAGRVMAGGRPVSNATVTMVNDQSVTRTVRTSSLGYYSFDNVPAGQGYVIQPKGKGYRFEAQALSVVTDLSNVNFEAQQ
jgi:Subtilase family/Carboxypeptidase regulatory-like domain